MEHKNTSLVLRQMLILNISLCRDATRVQGDTYVIWTYVTSYDRNYQTECIIVTTVGCFCPFLVKCQYGCDY